MNKHKIIQKFIEDYHPDYHSDEVARMLDLEVIMDDEMEEGSNAERICREEYLGMYNHPNLYGDYITLKYKILEKALLRHLEILQKENLIEKT